MSNSTESTATLFTKYGDLAKLVGNGEAIQLASIQGIGSSHELFEVYELGMYVYVDRLTDGPYSAVEGWHQKAHEFDAWGTKGITYREILMHVASKVADIVEAG